METGQELKQLLQSVSLESDVLSLTDYPAQNPLLVMRNATKSVVEINTLEGHSPRFSPNGQYLVTSSPSDDEPVRLYDYSGNLIQRLEGRFASFSPNSQYLVTFSRSSNDEPVRLYDLSGELTQQLEGDEARFSPDGQYLITFSRSLNDESVRLYDLSGNLIQQMEGRYASFSPPIDLKLVPTSCWPEAICLKSLLYKDSVPPSKECHAIERQKLQLRIAPLFGRQGEILVGCSQ